MISFDQAFSIVMDHVSFLRTEKVDLGQALKRVCAVNIYADSDIPPFNKSAMDGYACRKIDIGKSLKVIEFIAAGQMPEKNIGINQCSKIMTGAPVPDGADCVVPVELVDASDPDNISITGEIRGNNISYKGEDICLGDKLISAGTLLEPQHIAILASSGISEITVAAMPRVAILVTGNELVEPWQKPAPSQIRNSNAYQLIAQLNVMRIEPTYSGIIPDDMEILSEKFTLALSQNDIVILTGGVSMGDYDLVPEVFKKTGIEILFDSIAVQPGKPTTFGIHHDTKVFGLPGNPVSSFVQFEVLVKPMIYAMMKCHFKPIVFRFPMGIDFHRRNASRLGFFPVYLNNQEIFPVSYHGSGHLLSLAGAFGIMSIQPDVSDIKKGEMIDVRPIW